MKIINNAVKQKHGTMIVFAENAKEEAKRLRESSIPIEPTRVSEKFVNFATKIDGAMMCDEKGVCHSVGIILDGKASDDEDSSRGARYNSAIRYIDQQRRKGKKSFAVVVSEDGYINCFSTEKHKK